MKKQEEKSLDKLFEGLNELQHEQPSAAFLEDLELRLDALQQKRRKPLFAWWVWSVLGAVVIVSGLIASSKKSSFSASNASNRKSSQYQTSIKSSALKQTSAQTSAQASIKSSTSSFKLTSSTVTPLQDQSFISSSAISSSSSSSSSSSFSSLSSSTLIKNRDGSSTQVLSKVQSNNDLTASNSSLTSNAEKSSENQQPTENTKPAATTILDATPSEVSSDPKNLKMNKDILLDNLQPKQGQPKHSLGLQFGVSGIFSSFEVPGAIGTLAGYDPHLYRNVRSVSERQTSSWDFNLRYQFFFGRFGIQTGLNYLEWGEQYKYDVISVDGTNRYQYVQVPLCLAYQFPLKKVIFQPSIGFAIGYGLKTAGAYIQPALNQVELVNSSTWSKNSQLQLEFIYSLSNNLTVSIAPVYRRTFGNLIDNGVIMNRYQSVGLLTGFSFRF
ncbi:MAG: hypothetical protein RLZZ289_1325 [Bacteroidota bacterium]